jgi:hypothetical protein
MGIDLAKMRQKHAALTNRGGDSSDNFWKPEEGTHQIRLVCPPDGDPFFEAYYHYGMGAEGKTTVLSPRTNGDADPIAEWGTRLWNEGTDGSKEAAKRFWPKMRIFAPIVVRGEEDKGVRWWGFSRTTYQALLDVVLDPEYGDIKPSRRLMSARCDAPRLWRRRKKKSTLFWKASRRLTRFLKSPLMRTARRFLTRRLVILTPAAPTRPLATTPRRPRPITAWKVLVTSSQRSTIYWRS